MASVVFTVVMPVYNRELVVSRAIRSVLSQTYPNFELIVVDDKSTDQSVAAVRSIVDPRIHLITLATNSGPAVARNSAIRAAKGSLISFLDSDDEYTPDFLEKTLRCMTESPDAVGFMWTGVTTITRKGNNNVITSSCWSPKPTTEPYYQFLKNLQIGTNSGITIRKAVFDRVGLFDERLKAAEDTDLFLRITQTYQFTFNKGFLITIHQEEGDRLTRNKEKNAEAYEIIIEKNKQAIESDPQLKRKFWYKCMFLNYQYGNFGRARSYFGKLRSGNLLNKKIRFVKILYETLGARVGYFIHRTFADRTPA